MKTKYNQTPKKFLTFVLSAAITGVTIAGARSPQYPEKIEIAIASDSTAAIWHAPHPEKGWGQYLDQYFDRGIVIEDFAKPGASTKTFLEEGLWPKVVGTGAKYILIQFGHNDSHTPEHPEHTDADGLYADLLRRFVKEAREAEATPILVTPVARRTREDTLVPYVEAMKKVARETHTEIVDLHRLSHELYARLGERAQDTVGAQKTDLTHFNEAGAKMIAGIMAHELAVVVPTLRQHFKSRE